MNNVCVGVLTYSHSVSVLSGDLGGGAVHNAVVGIKARTCFDASLRQMFVAGARQTLSSRGYPPLLHLFITGCIDVLIELINKNG